MKSCQVTTPDLTWQCVGMKTDSLIPLTWQCVQMKSSQVTTPDLTGLQAGVSWAVRWAAPQAGTLHLPQWVEAGPRHSQQEAESPIVFFVILCNFKSFSIFVRVWLVFPRPVGAMDALCTCTCLASCSWLSFGTDYIFSLIWSESLAQTIFLVWSDKKLLHRLYF